MQTYDQSSPVSVQGAPLHSLHTALQGVSLTELIREFVAARAELEGFLHLLEHLLVVAE